MGEGVVMTNPENRIFCRLDGLAFSVREQKRLEALKELGLLEANTIPVFEEATQTAARFLDAPICFLGLMTQNELLLKSAVGLSTVGLMNQLAQSRQIPRVESFCTYVVDSHQALAINDTASNSLFASSLLVGHYGIRAYLGAPLLTVDGECLGTLAVMDWVPRHFTNKDLEFLAITARWSWSEFERDRLLKLDQTTSVLRLPQAEALPQAHSAPQPSELPNSVVETNSIKVKLLTQLTQELRTPLTSVMGMASVLGRQVYGPLTNKQKEYLEIIHRSGQHLVTLVEEIVALGILDETSKKLNLTSVDIEMLCQQAINNLSEMAQARQQKIRLTVEPGSRIWLMDRDKVRQMLYYLVYSIIHSAEAGGEVRIHVSRKSKKLKIAVWVSHPWLGEGIPPVYGGVVASSLPVPNLNESELEDATSFGNVDLPQSNQMISGASILAALTLTQELTKTPTDEDSRESLGLLLSCHLAELHKGQISVQGSLESGYRYVASLPELDLTVALE
ncbi:MAG: GAF domain-containing sensor histidine kinase [Coleofasciculaceae cyanobacterium]